MEPPCFLVGEEVVGTVLTGGGPKGHPPRAQHGANQGPNRSPPWPPRVRALRGPHGARAGGQ
eukprot:15130001-Alexandrium_andersonii.AAC.1